MRRAEPVQFTTSVIVFLVFCLFAVPSAFAAPSLLAIRIDATAVANPIEGVTGIEITVNRNDWGFFSENPPWYVTQTFSGLPGFLGTGWVRNNYTNGKLTYSGTAPLGGDAVRALDGLVFSDAAGPPTVTNVKLTGYDGPVTYGITSPSTWNEYDYYELYIILAKNSPGEEPTWGWPASASDWPTSTPEAQYMDAAKLDQMMDFIEQEVPRESSGRVATHSAIVIRRGHIVLEEYPNPSYNKDSLHIVNSVTKSVVSALVGIAMRDGHIESVDQKLIDLFPAKSPQNLDTWKRSITLDNVLTMKPGMAWDEWGAPYTDCNNDYVNALYCVDDPVQFVLDLPMTDEPGAVWNYNGGTSHLLSAFIASVSDTSDALDFAREFLFEPLGITRSDWESTPNGIRTGGGGIWLTPRDMARFGYLYLHGGVWHDTQVMPKDFVDAAVATHSYLYTTEFGVRGYGYQSWWTYPAHGVYYADGLNGQKIYVVPDQDLVVIFTAYIPNDPGYWQDKMVFDYIIPAADPIPHLPLSDAITVLKNVAGVETASEQLTVEDVNGDGQMGLAEAIYVLESNAGTRY